jgi:CBS domain containing-hemolysin-like protein
VIGLFVAVVFIALNGFFVAAEFALVKVRVTQLHSRVRKGDRKAIAAKSAVEKIERYLSVTQFGVTLASLGLGWIGEPAIAGLVEGAVRSTTGHPPGRAGEIVVIAIAFTLLTFSHVIFGELVPKLVAIRRSEQTALAVALPLRFIYLIFRPLLFILEKATSLILRAMGLSAAVANEGNLSENEIIAILAASASQSPGGKASAEILERVMRFAQRISRHAMVPRVDVAFIPIDTTGKEAREIIRTHQFSRLVLTKGKSLDEVAGYIYAKDFLLDAEAAEAPNLWNMRRDILFVPETQGLVDVLREMQRAHTPIAVVVDEYGGTSGIVTMEDLLEEIVGEIRDEFDEEPAHVVKVMGEEQTWDVDARAMMEELKAIGVTVAEDENAELVGATVVERLGRLPRKGDRVALDGHASAEITAVSRRRVTRLRVRVKKVATEGDAPPT